MTVAELQKKLSEYRSEDPVELKWTGNMYEPGCVLTVGVFSDILQAPPMENAEKELFEAKLEMMYHSVDLQE